LPELFLYSRVLLLFWAEAKEKNEKIKRRLVVQFQIAIFYSLPGKILICVYIEK
jgi:hypothetical protein